MRTTDDVVDFLSDLTRRAERGQVPEAYGVFAVAYHRVTLEVIARIADGFFADPGWLAEFDVRFAMTYRRALESPGNRPGPWAIAFAEADRGDKSLLRHLLLGINAHMSYDLCVVLLEGLVVDPSQRQGDFDAVNDVMRRAIDPIQAVLEQRYGPWLRRADALGLGVDEVLTYERFVDWRTRAWTDAVDIRAGRLTRADLDARVTRRAKWIRLMPF